MPMVMKAAMVRKIAVDGKGNNRKEKNYWKIEENIE
jgi:hypothetical protein